MSDTLASSEIKHPLSFGVLPPSTNADITVNLDLVLTALQPLVQISTIVSDLSVLLSTEAAQAGSLVTIITALESVKTKLDTSITSLQAIQARLDVNLSTRASEATLLGVKTGTDRLDVALSTRASEATLLTRVADATVTARLNTLGQKTMAASAPVVIASDQSAIPISGIVSITGPVLVDDSAVQQAVLSVDAREITVIDVLGEMLVALNLIRDHLTLITEDETINSENL
jgi:hypothetical protein